MVGYLNYAVEHCLTHQLTLAQPLGFVSVSEPLLQHCHNQHAIQRRSLLYHTRQIIPPIQANVPGKWKSNHLLKLQTAGTVATLRTPEAWLRLLFVIWLLKDALVRNNNLAVLLVGFCCHLKHVADSKVVLLNNFSSTWREVSTRYG